MSWTSPASFRLRQSLKAIGRLAKGARVLEVGCGAGQFIRAVKQIRPELECFGCDISEAAINSAQQQKDGVEYSLSEPSSLPYAHDYFDAILIYDVLEHAQDVPALLRECNRVLKADGVFYCFVPCEGDWLSLWNLLGKFHLGERLTGKYAGHINKFSRGSLSRLLRDYGFSPSRIRYSEHILGQLVGVASFVMMDRFAKKNHAEQVNNEEFFARIKSGALKKMVNFLLNLESAVFSLIPSPNVHITLKKTVNHL